MAQSDINVSNQTAPAFRTDLNNALEALATNSSGATAPSDLFGYMFWYDTSSNELKLNLSGNWVAIGTFDTGSNTFSASGINSRNVSLRKDNSISDSGNCSGVVILSYDGGEAANRVHIVSADVSITNSGGGTSRIVFQGSADNSTWTTIQTLLTSSTTNGVTVTQNYDNLIGTGDTFRYYRIHAQGDADHTFTSARAYMLMY